MVHQQRQRLDRADHAPRRDLDVNLHSVVEITPSGLISTIARGNGIHHPSALEVGPDGQMWFTILANGIGKVGTGMPDAPQAVSADAGDVR